MKPVSLIVFLFVFVLAVNGQSETGEDEIIDAAQTGEAFSQPIDSTSGEI